MNCLIALLPYCLIGSYRSDRRVVTSSYRHVVVSLLVLALSIVLCTDTVACSIDGIPVDKKSETTKTIIDQVTGEKLIVKTTQFDVLDKYGATEWKIVSTTHAEGKLKGKAKTAELYWNKKLAGAATYIYNKKGKHVRTIEKTYNPSKSTNKFK